jgi:hypothetical protein
MSLVVFTTHIGWAASDINLSILLQPSTTKAREEWERQMKGQRS